MPEDSAKQPIAPKNGIGQIELETALDLASSIEGIKESSVDTPRAYRPVTFSPGGLRTFRKTPARTC